MEKKMQDKFLNSHIMINLFMPTENQKNIRNSSKRYKTACLKKSKIEVYFKIQNDYGNSNIWTIKLIEFDISIWFKKLGLLKK